VFLQKIEKTVDIEKDGRGRICDYHTLWIIIWVDKWMSLLAKTEIGCRKAPSR
jgi:hypothetical protein